MIKKNGFILLEVLLSLLILGLVFAASMQALSSAIRAVSLSENLNTAASASQELLTLINRGEVGPGITSGRFDNGGPAILWEINRQSFTGFDNKYELGLTWQEQGQDKQFHLVTIRCL
jgi:type II secretory pathway pseudopilin PulG